jgi:hypothetical protein
MGFIRADGSEVDLTQHEPAQVSTKQEEPGYFQPGSKSEAVVRGASNAATLGLGKYIGGAVNGLVNGDPNKGTWQNIKDAVNSEVQANQTSQAQNPGSYMAGNVVAGLPMGAAAVGKTALTNIAANTAIPAITALADTQDPMAALEAGALGGALPAIGAAVKGKGPILDWIAKQAGAPEAAKEQVAAQVSKLGHPSSTITKKAKIAGLEKELPKNPNQLSQDVLDQGLSAIPDPLKEFVGSQTPNAGVLDVLKSGYRDIGVGTGAGAGVGSMFGMPGTGATIGGVVGGVKSAKQSLVNREINKALSPAAKAGAAKLNSKLNAMGDTLGGAVNSAKFGVISNFLNQTDPEVRAAMNPDNPLNQE